MDQLIHCSKCSVVPYDILMMNCSHNLCIKCAVQRMKTQHNVKSLVGRQYLQCEKCKGRTNLDQQSVGQLEKVQKNKSFVQKVYAADKDGEKRLQTPINNGRNIDKDKKQEKDAKNQIKIQQLTKTTGFAKNTKQHQKSSKTALNNSKSIQNSEQKTPIIPLTHNNITEKKQQYSQNKHQKRLSESNFGQCETHKQQPVMYYCFNCKIHCFCAECVLIGKHNQHDVKIIKKAYPIVQSQFKDVIAQTKKIIASLLQSNKLVANDINASKNQADIIKKTIEKGFDQIRTVVREKQLQFMKMIDKQFLKLMETNNGAVKKKIQTKLKQQQQLLSKLQNGLKRGEKFALNLYADQWNKIEILRKNQQIKIPTVETKFADSLNVYIAALRKQIEKVQIKKLQH